MTMNLGMLACGTSLGYVGMWWIYVTMNLSFRCEMKVLGVWHILGVILVVYYLQV